MMPHEHTEPDLYVVTEHDGVARIAPLLTCGHYGKSVHPCSSLWDFPDEAWVCPACAEERQINLKVQHLLYSGAWETE